MKKKKDALWYLLALLCLCLGVSTCIWGLILFLFVKAQEIGIFLLFLTCFFMISGAVCTLIGNKSALIIREEKSK